MYTGIEVYVNIYIYICIYTYPYTWTHTCERTDRTGCCGCCRVCGTGASRRRTRDRERKRRKERNNLFLSPRTHKCCSLLSCFGAALTTGEEVLHVDFFSGFSFGASSLSDNILLETRRKLETRKIQLGKRKTLCLCCCRCRSVFWCIYTSGAACVDRGKRNQATTSPPPLVYCNLLPTPVWPALFFLPLVCLPCCPFLFCRGR